MIVDDNADAAMMLAAALAEHGYQVRVAHDGPSALVLAREFTPEIGLVDIGLPVMDGYELADRLRQDPATASIRLIAVTGYGQDTDRERARVAGFAEHMMKPVDLTAVRRVVARVSAKP
jgi:CheY-like chemotaxis protein